MKRALQREKFLGVGDPGTLWWRPRGARTYAPFTAADLDALRARFVAAGNAGRLAD
jgi:hypothetical protein